MSTGTIADEEYIRGQSSLNRSAVPQAPFYEKCFNELGLPHRFSIIERHPNNFAGMEAWCNQRDFGGAYLDPGISVQTLSKHNKFFARLNNGQGPTLTEAARAIGIADTIVAKSGSSTTSTPPSMPSSPHSGQCSAGSHAQTGSATTTSSLILTMLVGEALCILLQEIWPPQLTLTDQLLFLRLLLMTPLALKIAKIYTVGFRAPTALARHAPPIEQFISLESLQRARSVADDRAPFVIVSALGSDKGNLVSMMLRAFAAAGREGAPNVNKVFLNLADVAARTTIDPHETAEKSGFASYGAADVAAFTIVESLRLLVGQNVPYSFVRLASGRHYPF
ncbi:hypothetical protein J3459_018565 [Metarhizium acridum]|nr:hypothetical protein J3459_018565 [Metarhizium acridum]